MVLMDRVLKLELCFEQDLCPCLIFGIREYPPLVVLSLNHEDAKARNQDVVYLCRAVAMLKRDVIQKVIVGRTKMLLKRFSHELAFPQISRQI